MTRSALALFITSSALAQTSPPPAPPFAETIEVSGIRAGEETPVTKSNMEREEIEQTYYGQDIPLLLRDTPSVNAYTESGIGGSGYSFFTLRGISQTRLNFTFDGVPLADSEDMGTYFANFTDLARSLQSIQIQRGVGTSTVGSPSFGGSINFESIDLSPSRKTNVHVGGGAFGTSSASVGHQSGSLPGGFAFYTRASYNESKGYRQHSGVRQNSLFFSGAKSGESSQIKLTGFSGREKQELSFFATDAETLKENPRFNPLTPEEKDGFGTDVANLQYLRQSGSNTNMTASAYYQRGHGWYRLRDFLAPNALREYGLDGILVGSMVTLSHTKGSLTSNYGVHVNRFEREHSRSASDGEGTERREYFNYGVKGEANAFAKFSYDRGKWLLHGDAQLRHAGFRYQGDTRIEPVDWTFFNPKIGARRFLTAHSSTYASFGISTREPTRNDMFQGEDNPTIAHDLEAVRPERLYDLEAGWDYLQGPVRMGVNVYAMEFRNEIAATGELSDIGLLLRRNVDRSYRRGVELDLCWQATTRLLLRTDANVSRNRIESWTQHYDVFDAGGVYVTSTPRTWREVEPLLTPPVIVSQSVDFAASPLLSAGATGRYVAKSYLDNTNDENFVARSFIVVDASVSLSLDRWMRSGSPRLALQIGNLFNEREIYPSGYSYLFITQAPGGAESIGGIPYHYPQATRNARVMLDLKM